MFKKIVFTLASLTTMVLVVGLIYFLAFRLSANNPVTTNSSSSSSQSDLTAQDCTKFEQYDPVSKECFYECDTDAECDGIAKLIEDELYGFFDQAKLSTPHDQKSKEKPTQENTYAIVQASPQPTIVEQTKQQVWDYFVTIATPEFIRNYLTQLSFFDNKEDTTMASVNQNSENQELWDLSVNMSFADDKDQLLYTLVHEFYHVLTLNKTQVELSTSSCPTLKLSEGCVKPATPLQQFYERFWSAINADPDANNFGEHYVGREEQFVTEYAGTNPIEDFAETLTHYTLKNTSSLSNLALEKIRFVDSFPELKSTATKIKANLGNELVKSRQLKANPALIEEEQKL